MPQERSLDDRLRALERRIDSVDASALDGEHEPTASDATRPAGADVEGLEARVAALEEQLTELQAGLQAVRGYVGNLEHVNQSVERRANAAIAAVERLESAPRTPPTIASASTDDTIDATDSDEDPADGPASLDSQPEGLLDRVAGHL